MSKESIRNYLISEGFKSLAPVEAYKHTNEQKKRRVEWCKEHQDFNCNSVILQTKLFLDVTRRKNEDEWKKEAKI